MTALTYCPVCAGKLDWRERSGRIRLICIDNSCGYTFWNNPRPVVAGIVEHEGQVVLTRNHGWPEGWYGLLTGFMEAEESVEEGMLREMKEEIGTEGEIVSFVGHYPYPRRNELIIAFHVRAWGEIIVGEELEAIKKIPLEQLRPWPSATGYALKDWLATRNIFNETLVRS